MITRPLGKCLLKTCGNGEDVGNFDQEIKCFNPFSNKPLFLCVCSTSLLKLM